MQGRRVDHIRKLLGQDRLAYGATEFLDTLVDLSEVVNGMGWDYSFPRLKLVAQRIKFHLSTTNVSLELMDTCRGVHRDS